MLVATRADGRLAHACFCELGDFLRAGDLLVVNTSGTLPAALAARLGARELVLHLSTPAGGEGPGDGTAWVVELRTTERLPFRAPAAGAVLELPGGATAELLAPYLGSGRLSVARLAAAASPSRTISAATAVRSATPTRPTSCRSRPTRPSSRATPAAPRCRARRGRSPPSW